MTSKNQISHDIDEPNTTTADNHHYDEFETKIVKTEEDINQLYIHVNVIVSLIKML